MNWFDWNIFFPVCSLLNNSLVWGNLRCYFFSLVKCFVVSRNAWLGWNKHTLWRLDGGIQSHARNQFTETVCGAGKLPTVEAVFCCRPILLSLICVPRFRNRLHALALVYDSFYLHTLANVCVTFDKICLRRLYSPINPNPVNLTLTLTLSTWRVRHIRLKNEYYYRKWSWSRFIDTCCIKRHKNSKQDWPSFHYSR